MYKMRNADADLNGGTTRERYSYRLHLHSYSNKSIFQLDS